MKGLHFYLEYPSPGERRKATRKNLGNHRGTVCAVDTDRKNWKRGANSQILADCFSAVQNIPNSVVCGSSCSRTYLKCHCLRVSEKQAREIHPTLFTYLEE